MTYSLPESGLLLRGNQVDESAFFKAPELHAGATWVAGADPFGGAALHANGGYMTLPKNPLITPRTSDWTFEVWVCPTASADAEIININKSVMAGRSAISIAIVRGGAAVVVGNDEYWINTTSYFGGKVPLNAWSYLEFVRAGGLVKAAINSGDVVSYSVGGADLQTNGLGNSVIGINDANGLPMPFVGLIGPMRFTAGIALRGSGGPLPVPTETFGPLPPFARGGAMRALHAASAPVPGCSTRLAEKLELARDVEVGGSGRIWGTTKIKGAPDAPTKARVVLLHQRSKLPVRETWSDPVTGAFVFNGIDTGQQFLALAEDAEGHFRPVAASRLTPEVA